MHFLVTQRCILRSNDMRVGHIPEMDSDVTKVVIARAPHAPEPFVAASPNSEFALSVLPRFSNATGPTPLLPGALTFFPGNMASYGSLGVQSHV